jgi:tRNA threonylcarbamoyl adenosine modification protein YeaZ
MAILGINTASSKTSIALIEKTSDAKLTVLAERSWEGKNNEAEKLMPEVSEMIKSCGKSFEDIKEIFCVKGPGSFTGLRVGVTVANTMKYLLGAKLYGMDYFEYLWQRGGLPRNGGGDDPAERDALLIFAGSSGVYASLSPKEDFEKDVKNININDLADFLKKNKIKKVFGDITDEQKKFLGSTKFSEKITKVKTSFGNCVAQIFSNHFSGKKILKDVQIIKPVYIKKPGITMSKSKFF